MNCNSRFFLPKLCFLRMRFVFEEKQKKHQFQAGELDEHLQRQGVLLHTLALSHLNYIFQKFYYHYFYNKQYPSLSHN